ANGTGTEQSHVWAVFWYAVALQNGYEKAASGLKANIKYLDSKTVTAETVNVRNGRSTDFPVIGRVHEGDKVYVLGTSKDWSQVYLPKLQKIGWVASWLLQ